MAQPVVTIELPSGVAELFTSIDEAMAYANQAIVLQLLRDGQISQGTAASLLDITRWDLLELMGRYQIPSGPRTADELNRDLAAVQQFLQRESPDARHQ